MNEVVSVSEVNLLSFLTCLLLQTAGLAWHWRKMKKENRVSGTFFDYLFYDKRANSATTVIMLVASSWAACAAGFADHLNPELVWAMLLEGKITVATGAAISGAIVTGHGLDSMFNAGEKT